MKVVHSMVLMIMLTVFASCGGSSTDLDRPADFGGNGAVDEPGELVSKDTIEVRASSALPTTFMDPTPEDKTYFDLIAGQSADVGDVAVTNDGDNFYVEYVIDEEGWLIHEVHVYIGCDEPESGAPGQFPFVDDEIDPGVTSYTATIPIADVCPDGLDKGPVYVATHAVVCTEGDEGEPYGGYVLGETGTVTMWAGQHYNSGELTAVVVGDNLEVTYATSGGWLMSETQLYVGATAPSGSAPGQFPYKATHDPYTDTYTFEIPLTDFSFFGGDGSLYIAAHATVHLFDGDGNEIQSETSWSWPDGEGLPGENEPKWHQWGKYFMIDLTWDWFSGDPTGGYCETAWGGPDGFGGKGKLNNKFHWNEFGWDKKWGGYFAVCAMPFPELPADQVGVKGFHWGTYSFWDVVFSNQSLPLPVGDFTTSRGVTYSGWCIDRVHAMYPNLTYQVTLYSSYDTTIPSGAGMPITSNGNFDFVNYMVNQRHNPTDGGPFDGVNWMSNTNKQQFQNAVWYFTNYQAVGANSLAEKFIEDAIANGDNFVPCEGDYYGIVLYPDTSSTSNRVRAQFNLIEVDP